MRFHTPTVTDLPVVYHDVDWKSYAASVRRRISEPFAKFLVEDAKTQRLHGVQIGPTPRESELIRPGLDHAGGDRISVVREDAVVERRTHRHGGRERRVRLGERAGEDAASWRGLSCSGPSGRRSVTTDRRGSMVDRRQNGH